MSDPAKVSMEIMIRQRDRIAELEAEVERLRAALAEAVGLIEAIDDRSYLDAYDDSDLDQRIDTFCETWRGGTE